MQGLDVGAESGAGRDGEFLGWERRCNKPRLSPESPPSASQSLARGQAKLKCVSLKIRSSPE